MATKREGILAAITTALAGTTGVSSRIYRSRAAAFARSESPAIVIEPVQDVCSTNTSLPTLDWGLMVRITIIVRAPIPDQAADPVIESMHSKLMADLTLGGRAMDIIPEAMTYAFSDADLEAGEIQCDYRVRYRTTVTSLAT